MKPLVLSILLLVASANASNSSGEPSQFFGGQDLEAYLRWVEATRENYPVHTFVASSADPDQGAAVHWRIDGDQLELGIAVRATGWLGFGLTVNGGMTGADMLLFEARSPLVVRDAYVGDERFPVDDDCQDWQLVNATADDDFLLVQVRRKLDTGDSQDWSIRNDQDLTLPTSRIIAAWGDDEAVSYHGPNNARGAVRWFRTDSESEAQLFQEQMAAQAQGKFVVAAKNHTIQPIETEYAHFCFGAAELEEAGVPLWTSNNATLIGFEPIVDNSRHVHHFVLYASSQDWDGGAANCSQGGFAGEVAYVWAPGEPPLAFPDNVGFPLGNTSASGGGYLSFQLEIHYDNPTLVEGQLDSSGLALYYSLESRKHEAGYFMIGDPNVALAGQMIARGITEYTFECPGTCSQLALASAEEEENSPSSVTVLREYLHMHQSGYSTGVEQWRDGELVRTGKIEYFDFAQTGNPAVPQSAFDVRTGDAFRLDCYYRNSDSERTFGLASSDEMCMAFLLYYPRKRLLGGAAPWMCGVGFGSMGLSECDSAWTSKNVTEGAGSSSDGANVGRKFGLPTGNSSGACPAEQAGEDGETSGSATSWVGMSRFFVQLAAIAVSVLSATG